MFQKLRGDHDKDKLLILFGSDRKVSKERNVIRLNRISLGGEHKEDCVEEILHYFLSIIVDRITILQERIILLIKKDLDLNFNQEVMAFFNVSVLDVDSFEEGQELI